MESGSSMSKLTRFVLLMASFFASSSLQQALPAHVVPADTVVTLQRGDCERRCAVYKVIVFADGTLIYDGQYSVRRQGLVLGHLEDEQLLKLVDAFTKINYFALKDEYGYQTTTECDSLTPDGPIVKTSLVTGGRTKAIVHHHRCAGAVPKELSALEDEIDQIAQTARWTK
jgi:hypothetical protein